MRLQVIDPEAKFSCGGCTNCCTQPYAVIIEEEKARALDQHDFSAWSQLEGRKLYSESKDAPAGFYVLEKQPGSTRCLFLADDGLCIIHKEMGADAKPHPCLQFPYHLSATYTEDRISLSFGCPTVQKNEGAPLTSQQDDVQKIVEISRKEVYPDLNVPLNPSVSLSQDEFNAMMERLESIFAAPGEQSVWSRFADSLSLVEAVAAEKETSDEDLAETLRAGAPAISGLMVPDVDPFPSHAQAPSPVRMLFASTLLRDILPPDVTLNLSLAKRVMLLPKLMPLAKLSGRYESKLLGREVDLDAVSRHRLQPGMDPTAAFLLNRYFRTRLWERFLVGTRLSVAAGLHQHILDFNAILFLARAMACHEGADRLTQPIISQALSHVELNIANQPRPFGQKALAWFTGQLDDLELARDSLRLMALPNPSSVSEGSSSEETSTLQT
jgi:Fe-S-cluster containining protein